MKIKLKNDININNLNEYLKEEYNVFWSIQKNKIYTVIDISYSYFRIIDETGEACLFSAIFFDIIDDLIGINWTISFDNYNEKNPYKIELSTHLVPKELKKFSYEDLDFEEKESINIFLNYITKYNIQMVANLAYAPKNRKEYYDNILEKIDKKIKL